MKTDKAFQVPFVASNSFPALKNYSFRAIYSREFGENQSSSLALRDFESSVDGYDVHEIEGSFASSVGTRDPSTLDYNFHWFSPGCKEQDGWVLFPNSVAGYGSGTFSLGGASQCPQEYEGNFTEWELYTGKYQYTSGKSLETIKTFHYSHSDPRQAKEIEVSYFTRLYGATRWERWESYETCVKLAQIHQQEPAARCSDQGVQS